MEMTYILSVLLHLLMTVFCEALYDSLNLETIPPAPLLEDCLLSNA